VQTFLDFRNEIGAPFDIDLAEPRLDLLSFELGRCPRVAAMASKKAESDLKVSYPVAIEG
jgi:hypothetical protein